MMALMKGLLIGVALGTVLMMGGCTATPAEQAMRDCTAVGLTEGTAAQACRLQLMLAYVEGENRQRAAALGALGSVGAAGVPTTLYVK